ncbi:MAG: histidine kinase [Limisphaerales bacterium]
MNEQVAITSRSFAVKNQRRWRLRVFFIVWTLLALIAAWWLLGHEFAPSKFVMNSDGGTAIKSWSERFSEWLVLAHVNFQPAYPWLLLGPYVVWLGVRFHIAKRGWPWRLALLLVAGAGFVFLAQEFSGQLRRNSPALVVFSGNQDFQRIAVLDSANTNADLPTGHTRIIASALSTNVLGRNARWQKTVKVNEVTIQASGDPPTNSVQTGRLMDDLASMITTNLLPALKDELAAARGRSGIANWSVALDSLAYVTLIGLAHAGLFHRRYREREQQATLLENRLNQARLRTLQAQLQPHFLFNALNGIATLVRRDPAAAEEMITSLSELLRLALSQSERQEIPLRDEMEFLNRYLEIQQMRFRDKLGVEQSIEPAALDCLVPALLLQPLVENAIRHGLEPSPDPGLVRITAAREGTRLVLTVEDNGVGLGHSNGNGLGLANVRERLEALYPSEHEFQFGERPGSGVIVCLSIPWKTASPVDKKLQPDLAT